MLFFKNYKNKEKKEGVWELGAREVGTTLLRYFYIPFSSFFTLYLILYAFSY